MTQRPADTHPIISPQKARLDRKPRSQRRDWPVAFMFLLPAGLVLITFHFLPIFYAFYISLHKWGLMQESFIGLENYATLLRDTQFWQSLGVTLWFVVGTVPVGILISLVIALLLFGEMKARGFFRTIYFLPYITSVVAAAMAWSWIYNPQYGILNFVLEKGGLPTQQWIQDPTGIFQVISGMMGVTLPVWAQGPSLALVSIMAMTVWNMLGFNIVILLAGLGAVPKEIQEAAKIDGAGDWGVFRHVIWPLLTPTTFFLLIVNTIRAFQAFNQIYVMTLPTPGSPLGTTEVVTVYIFSTFYQGANMGYGAALAFGLFIIILTLTFLQFRLAGERVSYG